MVVVAARAPRPGGSRAPDARLQGSEFSPRFFLILKTGLHANVRRIKHHLWKLGTKILGKSSINTGSSFPKLLYLLILLGSSWLLDICFYIYNTSPDLFLCISYKRPSFFVAFISGQCLCILAVFLSFLHPCVSFSLAFLMFR